MKFKIAAVFASFLLMVHSFLYAQAVPMAPSLPVPAAAPAGPAVGIVAVVKGQVEVGAAGGVGRVVSSGETVYLGDAVTTGPEGTLQILLLDETVFTIGPSSSIVIDKFVYDPSTHDGQINARVLKGVFRLVTGNIGKKEPKNMGVKLPSGEVGIRGTMLYGSVDGDHSTLLLLGPGENNNTQHRKGEIAVRNEVDGEMKESVVNKSGFGSEIPGANEAPLPAFRFSEEQINAMTAPFSQQGQAEDDEDSGSGSPDSGTSDPAAAEGESATEQAGQDTFIAADQAGDLSVITEVGEDLNQEAIESSQESADDFSGMINGLTTLEDLATIETGQFKFVISGDMLNSSLQDVGNFQFKMNIDFGMRNVGGGNSRIDVTASNINSNNPVVFNLPAESFDTGAGGFGVFDFPTQADIDATPCATCSAHDIEVILFNADGNIAQTAIATFRVVDSVNTADGAGIGDRTPGQV